MRFQHWERIAAAQLIGACYDRLNSSDDVIRSLDNLKPRVSFTRKQGVIRSQFGLGPASVIVRAAEEEFDECPRFVGGYWRGYFLSVAKTAETLISDHSLMYPASL